MDDQQIPIWVADYVLMEYGTGAIMAVPAHDQRDVEFAERYDLPIVPVIGEDGTLVSSAQFDGLLSEDGKRAIVAWLGERGQRPGSRSTTGFGTGASRASGTGAARSRSSTAANAGS